MFDSPDELDFPEEHEAPSELEATAELKTLCEFEDSDDILLKNNGARDLLQVLYLSLFFCVSPRAWLKIDDSHPYVVLNELLDNLHLQWYTLPSTGTNHNLNL